MNSWRNLRSRWAALFHKGKLDAQMDEELRSHVEMQTRENIEAGMNLKEARRAALRQFGRIDSIKETCREQRDNLVTRHLSLAAQDLRYGTRTLAKNPGFTAVAVLTLALGIGATTAVFSLVKGVLLTPPPYPQPEKVVLISPARLDGQPFRGPVTAGQCVTWQRQAKSFEAVAGYYWLFNFLVRPEGSESAEGMAVSPEYFTVTGLSPALGRSFTREEISIEQSQAVIISHELWQRVFHGNAAALGAKLQFSHWPPLTVVGIMPPNIRFLPAPMSEQTPNYDLNARVDFWVPAAPDKVNAAQPIWNAAGRLRDGISLVQAQAELMVLAATQAKDNPKLEGITARLQPIEAELNQAPRGLLQPLFGAALVVLIIACGNVAGLLLARGRRRAGEFNLRNALGASRARLVRQALTESFLLALPGGGLGILLAHGAIKACVAMGGSAIPRLDMVTTDRRLLLFSLAVAVFSAVVAGLVPAFRNTRTDLATALKGSGPNTSADRDERRVLGLLTTAQTALTLALLAGAALLLRTMHNLASVQPGYETRNILAAMVTVVEGDERRFHREALERVSALPGVRAVAFAWGVPLTGQLASSRVALEGQTMPESNVATRLVTPAYFALVGMRLQDGRGFHDRDNTNSTPVVVINQAMAERFFADQNPLGKKLRVRGWWGGPREVVGVVANVRSQALDQAAGPELYLPLDQAAARSKHLLVRTDSPPRAAAANVWSELRALSPSVAIEGVTTFDQIRADSTATRRFATQTVTVFALTGGLLAVVAIHGALSLSVGQRQRELAIRLAVGAQRRDVLGLVLREWLGLIGAGLILGVLLAVGASRLLGTLLYGVAPADPLALASAALIFVVAALASGWFPARRAITVNPMTALRNE